MAAARRVGTAPGRESRRWWVAGVRRQVNLTGAGAPRARSGTMTVTRLDQGQRHRPRMAFLKKVRAGQHRGGCILAGPCGARCSGPGGPGVHSALPGHGSPRPRWMCEGTAPAPGLWGHDLLQSPVAPGFRLRSGGQGVNWSK